MSYVLDKSFIHRSYPKLTYGSIYLTLAGIIHTLFLIFTKLEHQGGVATGTTTSSKGTNVPRIWSATITKNDGATTTHTVWRGLLKKGLPHNTINPYQ